MELTRDDVVITKAEYAESIRNKDLLLRIREAFNNSKDRWDFESDFRAVTGWVKPESEDEE